MNKNFSFITLWAFLLCSTKIQAQTGCIDTSLINPDIVCPAVYEPVCGCNGITYGNSCEAVNAFGITSFVPGECPPQSCNCEYNFQYSLQGAQLHAGFDFGDIDPPFFFYVDWSLDQGQVSGSGLDFVTLVTEPGTHILCATYPTGDFADITCTVCQTITVAGPACIDPEVIDTNIVCPQVYEPVCGCDGITYPNECIAYNHYGVRTWTAGVCPDQCINPEQIDTNMACLTVFDPVCGCDSVTYSNECYAAFFGGVTSWTKGACCNNPACQALFEVTVLPNNTVYIKNKSVNAEASVLNLGDGAWHGGVFEELTHTYSAPGPYQICLEISSFAGDCSDTYCQLINFTSPTGEPLQQETSLVIAPNPAHDQAQVQVVGANPQRAWLFDMQGKLVWQENNPTSYFQLNARQFPPGLYQLQVQTDRGFVAQKWLVE